MSTTTSFFGTPSKRRWAISASSSGPAPGLKELVGELCAIGLSAQIKSDSQPGTAALDATIRAGASDIMALDADLF
ncbi:hypothetical protein [Rhizobium mongolense]|uniref:hypothetical protein n=1 Tax=Rhizobium mongolense TaxID=57676 RepID=UPI0034A189C3